LEQQRRTAKLLPNCLKPAAYSELVAPAAITKKSEQGQQPSMKVCRANIGRIAPNGLPLGPWLALR